MVQIFISKDAHDLNEGLQHLHKNGVLEAKSLIEFSALPFECPPAYDILFLASIRAAEYFFAKCDSSAQIACAGVETAQKVAEKFKKEIAFIAQQSDQPELEARRFNEWRKNRIACFPSSQLSIGTYASMIPNQEKIVFPIYQTHFLPQPVENKDIYIFSSPSNVIAFAKYNTIAEDAKVVAWGSSTERELLKNGINVTYVLRAPQQTDLLNWLHKLL